MKEYNGKIHSFETFGSVDGPGVRFVVFLKGCNMRCQFCHNPDTWDMENGAIEMSAEEVLKKALRYRPYWKNGGGITVSGGEPLLQIDFVTELFRLAKVSGVNTALDTSGSTFSKEDAYLEKFDKLMNYTNLVMLDIKQIDEQKHMLLTGRTNKNILDMARYLSKIKKDMWVRHVLVPGGSDDDELLKRLASFLDTLDNVKRVEVLPYHTLGVHKWKSLGIDYSLKDVNPPTAERIENAERILKTKKVQA